MIETSSLPRAPAVMAESYALDSGTYYIIVGWVLTGVAASAVALRLYSRTILTRSAGSDDLAIVLAVV